MLPCFESSALRCHRTVGPVFFLDDVVSGCAELEGIFTARFVAFCSTSDWPPSIFENLCHWLLVSADAAFLRLRGWEAHHYYKREKKLKHFADSFTSNLIKNSLFMNNLYSFSCSVLHIVTQMGFFTMDLMKSHSASVLMRTLHAWGSTVTTSVLFLFHIFELDVQTGRPFSL